MDLMNIFHWPFEARSQPPKPKTEGVILWGLTTMMTVFLMVTLFLGLVLALYLFIAKKQTSGCPYIECDTQEPILFGSLRRKQKRWKPKKSSKKRKSKAQRLEEVNRKWCETYGSDHSDYEEKEDLQTVPMAGNLKIAGAKKVSFRDIIKEVYLIESKEEMKRLEQLHKLGYDVTIRNFYAAGYISREHAPKATHREDIDKEHNYPTQLLCSSFDRNVKVEEEDVLPKRLKNWFNASDLKEVVENDGVLNHTLDEKERLRNK